MKPNERLQRAAARLRDGHPADAERACRWVLERHPGHPGALCLLGDVQVVLGRTDAAAECYRAAVGAAPNLAEAHFRLALVNRGTARINEAVAGLRHTLSLRPDHAGAWTELAEILVGQGDADEAVASARNAAARAPDDADLQCRLGRVFADTARWEEALACYERALALRPGDPEATVGKAAALGGRGEAEAAVALLEPLLAGDAPHPRAAVILGHHSRRLGRQEEALDRIERALARSNPEPGQRKSLCFAAGAIEDALGRYDAAFAHYAEGNRLAAEPYDPDAFTAEVDRLIAAFGAGALAGLPRAPNADPRPVFIVGMPRSGTTLVEQILASHHGVHGAGELHDVPRMAASLPRLLKADAPYPECVAGLTREVADTLSGWYLGRLAQRASGAARVTDKMPHNFLHLGLIALLLPGARVIHCVREAADTCLSCHFQDFSGVGHPYTHDLAALGRYYRDYRRLMAHWEAVLDPAPTTVRYEEMVADPEGTSRALVATCGLEWDPACLDFFRSGRFVKTASRDQVNRPVYRTSAGRWRNYRDHLGALFAALGPHFAPE